MTQNRDLLPVTVYLPADKRREAEKRARTSSMALATLLRRILLGQEKPLR